MNKNLVFITDWTPTRDNIGPSAHLFHLLCNRPSGYTLYVYSTNINKIGSVDVERIKKELKAELRLIPKAFLTRLVTSERLRKYLNVFYSCPLPANSYYVLPKKIKTEIDDLQPDILWIYPHSLIRVAKQFPNVKKIVTGADCASLHTSRLLRDNYAYEKLGIKETLIQFRKRVSLEQLWSTVPHVWMHVVGQTDEDMFHVLAPTLMCSFFPHPHYSLKDKLINLEKRSLKVLISGKYDVYTYTDSNIFVDSILDCDNEIIRSSLEFTFHGKGWSAMAKRMSDAGFSVIEAGWVDDYVQFISGYDIQLFPISVGSGTKGKVLDGLSTGLLCIGSRYAFENIAVTPGIDCLIYNSPKDIVNILVDVLNNTSRYMSMADSGRSKVRKYHNPSIIARSILDWCIEGRYAINSNNYYHLPLK